MIIAGGIVSWFVLSFVVGLVAAARGQSFIATLFVSFILSPLVGFLIVACLPVQDNTPIPDLKICPQCRETVLLEASKCKHCRSTLTDICAGGVPEDYVIDNARNTAKLKDHLIINGTFLVCIIILVSIFLR